VTRTVYIALNRSEGALLRLLGTVQRRGFDIAAVRTMAHEDAALWRIELELAPSARDLAVLLRQLARLYDVAAIETPLATEPLR